MKKALLGLCALMALVAMVGAIMSGVVVYGMSAGHARYAEQSYGASAQAYGVAQSTTPDRLGRWEAYFGAGTAELRAGAITDAIATLSTALDLVLAGATPERADANSGPGTGGEAYTDECKVRMNLSIAQGLDAERLSQAGYAKDSQRAYSTAADTVRTCAEQGATAKQQFEEAMQKAAEEEEKAHSQANESETPENAEAQEHEGENESGEELKDRELNRRAKDSEQQRRTLQEYDKDFASMNGENW